MYCWVLWRCAVPKKCYTSKEVYKSLKNQSECINDESQSNFEIVSNEYVSMSNQCESNQDNSESSVCDSHYASAYSLKISVESQEPWDYCSYKTCAWTKNANQIEGLWTELNACCWLFRLLKFKCIHSLQCLYNLVGLR